MTVRVGVFGTSWWADAMYLPPISSHPDADVVAVCGRRPESTAEFAGRWGVDDWFVDPTEMLETVDLDAVIVATANDTHHDLAIAALDRGLHVLCEKPLALDVEQAAAMARHAEQRRAVTLVPFTYHYMPAFQWVKQLVADGYVGNIHHINARYYTSYGFDPAYSWRFDRAVAGSGVIGDLGAHWVHLSRWLLGERERSVSAVSSTFVGRGPRPDGTPYDQTEDSAVLTVRYESGAYGVLQVSTVCWEGDVDFGQSHHLEVHGDAGTIHATCDWDAVQDVRGARRDHPGRLAPLPIPDSIWGDVRRDTVHNTYRDVFRETEAMTRGWITAIVDGVPIEPSFAEGLAVQRVLDAAVSSAASGGCPVDLAGS